jgi:hypothetical protein
MKELKLTDHDNRPTSEHDPAVRVPAALNTEGLDAMPYLDMNAMLWFSDRWWWFPGSRIGWDSEFEWRDSGVYLLEPDGTAVKGAELSEAEIEQLSRETLLSDVLELAAAKLRSGEGWDEGTTTDVLNEIEHAIGLERD